jgi:hypothetical protein
MEENCRACARKEKNLKIIYSHESLVELTPYFGIRRARLQLRKLYNRVSIAVIAGCR